MTSEAGVGAKSGAARTTKTVDSIRPLGAAQTVPWAAEVVVAAAAEVVVALTAEEVVTVVELAAAAVVVVAAVREAMSSAAAKAEDKREERGGEGGTSRAGEEGQGKGEVTKHMQCMYSCAVRVRGLTSPTGDLRDTPDYSFM